MKLEEKNQLVENTDICIMDKLNVKSAKLSLLVKLIDDLKSNFEDDIENLNKLNNENNIMKTD